MGNQQERLTAQVRLAMLYDTEGYITMAVTKRGPNRNLSLVPLIAVSNTSVTLVEWAASALEYLGVGRYVQWNKPHGIGKLAQGRVTVQGLLRVQDLLPNIRPYLIVKQKQADLLHEFIGSRLAAGPKDSYTDRELDIANQIRSLNTKGKGWRPVSSTTTRDATVELRKHLTVDDIV